MRKMQKKMYVHLMVSNFLVEGICTTLKKTYVCPYVQNKLIIRSTYYNVHCRGSFEYLVVNS